MKRFHEPPEDSGTERSSKNSFCLCFDDGDGY